MRKRLKFLKKHIQNLGNYRKVSNPPNAGEPIITANVTTIPKSTPTIMKRLFMIKISSSPVKNGLYCNLEKIWKNALKEKS